MKKTIVLLILALSIGTVYADNLFQSNNPFPQKMPQSMNNIYESEPATIQDEIKKEKKSWFRKGKNLQRQERQQNLSTYPADNGVNEGANNGSFYVFK